MDLHLAATEPTAAERSAVDAVLDGVVPAAARSELQDAARGGRVELGGARARRGVRHQLLPALHGVQDAIGWISPAALGYLCRRLDVPLCMSDQPELQFANGAHLARTGAARLIRGTAAKLGITGLKKLCSLAEGFGLNCEIGTAGNALLQAANLHVIFSVGNCDFYEYWMPQSAHQFGLVESITLNERGAISAPTAPGLGYEIDWEWVRRRRTGTLR